MAIKVLPSLDGNGCLPQKCFRVGLKEFKERFVFIKNEKIRKKLFNNYESFCKRFENIIIRLWVNGSYTTNKLNPRDIDVAVHYDAIKFNDLSEININEKRSFNNREYIEKEYSLHLLPVPVYPEDHPAYRLTKMQSEKWKKMFLKDTRKNPPLKKGFVELINGDE